MSANYIGEINNSQITHIECSVAFEFTISKKDCNLPTSIAPADQTSSKVKRMEHKTYLSHHRFLLIFVLFCYNHTNM